MLNIPVEHKLYYYWGKAAFLILVFHGIVGFWDSFKFLVLEYPRLEGMLQAHILTASEVTEITISGIILMVTTIIAITMALRLHSTREQVANAVDLVLSTIIIAATPFARGWLMQLPWEVWLESLI